MSEFIKPTPEPRVSLLLIIIPVLYDPPDTSNFAAGLVVPIPTLPSYLNTTKSVVGFAKVLPPTILNVFES